MPEDISKSKIRVSVVGTLLSGAVLIAISTGQLIAAVQQLEEHDHLSDKNDTKHDDRIDKNVEDIHEVQLSVVEIKGDLKSIKEAQKKQEALLQKIYDNQIEAKK